jgi:hypothetical protein
MWMRPARSNEIYEYGRLISCQQRLWRPGDNAHANRWHRAVLDPPVSVPRPFVADMSIWQ